MSRGWESKDVESQQDAFSRGRAKDQPKLTPEQIELETKRDSLNLQRTRVLKDLETCKNDRVRKTLEDGLAYLDAQLKKLGET
jgi:hypothetical protein